jgi:hypothetical protein
MKRVGAELTITETAVGKPASTSVSDSSRVFEGRIAD